MTTVVDGARVLLFTGKGGVGKTTVAAATALRCADVGLRTLVLSTDPAHSLADALDVELGPLSVQVAGELWGQQLDAQDRMEEAWGDIQAYLTEVLTWAGADALEAEELAVLPGLDELFALTDINDHAGSGRWDVVVVDCAPTAETLRLLALPQVLSWYMERLFPVGRRVNRVVAPVLSRVSSLPVAGDGVFAATQRVYARLEAVRELLADVRRTSVRLVVNPERVVVAEARRLHTYLSLFGYQVDAVVANRLLPDGITDPWFESWKRAHAEHLAGIEAGFAPVPVLRAELAPGELIGVEALRRFGAELYGDDDPSGRFHEGDGLQVQRRNGHHVLRLPLPGAAREEVDLGRRAGELLVRVGSHRRAVVLPDSLRHRRVTGARLEAGVLEVSFGGRS